MVEWSIAAFRAAESVGTIVVACPPGHAHDLLGDDLEAIDGGAARAESVANALAAVETKLVAIHDAARPMLTPALISEVVATLAGDWEADGAVAAAPVTDTIKRAGADLGAGAQVDHAQRAFAPYGGVNAPRVVEETLDRGRLWAVQTPQVFRVEALRRALEAGPEQVAAATDEAMLVEAMGGRVLIHPSSPENFKVTTPLDLKLAELMLGG